VAFHEGKKKGSQCKGPPEEGAMRLGTQGKKSNLNLWSGTKKRRKRESEGKYKGKRVRGGPTKVKKDAGVFWGTICLESEGDQFNTENSAGKNEGKSVHIQMVLTYGAGGGVKA